AHMEEIEGADTNGLLTLLDQAALLEPLFISEHILTRLHILETASRKGGNRLGVVLGHVDRLLGVGKRLTTALFGLATFGRLGILRGLALGVEYGVNGLGDGSKLSSVHFHSPGLWVGVVFLYPTPHTNEGVGVEE